MLLKTFQINKKPESPFRLFEKSKKNPKVDIRSGLKVQQEKSLAGVLFVFLVILLLYPTYTDSPPQIGTGTHLFVSEKVIPTTTQHTQKRPPPPDRPAIPIEAEVEDMAEDITIDFEDISFSELPPLPGRIGVAPKITVRPRLIKQVVPYIRDKDKKKGIKGAINLSVEVDESGRVTDVLVLESSIDNENIVKSVIEAAYKCLFIPAKKESRNVKVRTFIKYDVYFSK